MFQSRVLAFLGGAALCLGCTGSIDGQSGKPPTDDDPTKPPVIDPTKPPPVVPPKVDNTGALNDSATVPGANPLRRLTRLEYDNTIRDLLGVSSTTAGGRLTPDQGSHESGFTTGGSITGSSDARAVLASAEEIATAAVGRLGMILPCNSVPTARPAQDTCADEFVEKFGMRAFRRPLTTVELADLKALYRAHRAANVGDTFEQAIAGVITAVLQTPSFLYHWEIAPTPATKEGNILRLGPYELASRLSYLFWASMPDEALFAAAQSGKLNSPDDIAREARRLLGSEKAKAGLQDFFVQWLELGNLADLTKDPALTLYTPALVEAINAETRDFVDSLFFGAKADGKLETLLTSRTSVIEGNLAKLYGVTGFTGTTKKPTELDAAKRGGIFTQAGFLSTHADPDASHPIKRGDAVLRRLLCTELIIPADLIVPPLPEPLPTQTTRERYEVHSASPCATCHKVLDPIGFAFEHYDAIGGYRDTEVGKPIDAKGTMTVGKTELKFNGAVEMMKQLATTPEAKACMATQWLRYSLRRREVMGEAPSVKVLEAGITANTDLRELMVAATKARTFTHRAISPGEVTQ